MTPAQTYTLALIHAVADLLRSAWPVVVLMLALMFWRQLARLIGSLAEAEFSGFGMRVKLYRAAIAQAKQALTRLPAPAPDPRAVVASTDPKMARVLVDVDKKPLSFDALLAEVADVYRLPHTPTAWVTASQLLTAATITVAATGSAQVKGDQVTISLNPYIRQSLEERAKEEK